MRSTRSLSAVVIAITAMLLVPGVLSLQSASGANTPVPSVGLLRLGSAWDQGSGYDRYSTVIVSSWAASRAAPLPGRSLVYMSGTNVDSSYDTGVTYTQATANNWLLRDANDTLLTNTSYPKKTVADVGSSAYQKAWVDNVAAFIATNGNDGVFIDDVIADVSVGTGGKFPAKYPTKEAWADALASFLAYVGPAMKAKGYYVAVNADAYTRNDSTANDGSRAAAWATRIAPSVNGVMQEFWLQSPVDYSMRSTGGNWNQYWEGWLNLVSAVQSQSRDFIGLTYGAQGDSQKMRFGKASFLLAWDGGGSVFVYNPLDGSDPWSPDWTTNIGVPVASKYQVGQGWRREFTGGTVLVNPNPSTSQTFQLGASYLAPDGSTVSSVTLAPVSGMVLTSTSTPPPPVQKPASLTAPAISGTAQETSSVAATTGTWSGNPTSYAYAWQRCDTSGAACTAITGANAATYTLSTSEVGKTARVVVTATNTAGSTAATSAATAVVTAAAPAPVPAPAPGPTSDPAPPGSSGHHGKGKKEATRTFAVAKPAVLEWEGRLFSSSSEFRRYLDRRGVAWKPFLDAHPAVVRAFGIPSVVWDGRTFYSPATLKRWLGKSGVSYATWAKEHARSAASLAGKRAATSPSAQPQVLSRTAVATWDGIDFTKADALRSHLREQGIAWEAFLGSHPAIAKAFGL